MKELNKSAEIVEKENHYLDQRQFVFLWGPAVSCPVTEKEASGRGALRSREKKKN